MAGEILKDVAGNPIRVGAASTVFAVDWNGDGLLDLLCGNIEGEVYLIVNEGTAREFKFGCPHKLIGDGKPIHVGHDSHPVAADWDGDGLLDVLVGDGGGSVSLYRNIGSKQAPKLSRRQILVPTSSMFRAPDTENTGNQSEYPWGMRSKICVADWNGDGKLDLLLGDFRLVQGKPRQLTDQERAEKDRIEKRYREVFEEYTKRFREAGLQKYFVTPADESAEAKKERQKQLNEALQKFQKNNPQLLDELNKLSQARQRFLPETKCDGSVWVFLRK